MREFLARSLSHEDDYTCAVLGRDLWVHPQVMSPRYSYSPTFVVRHWDEAAFPGATVLDVGTGCGVLAVFAALAGAARVVALDVNPHALRIARRNARLHGAGERVHVLASDGLAALAPRPTFDVLLFNPPYFDHPYDPAVPLTRGVFDPGHRFLRHVLEAAPSRLAPGGRALVVLGSSGLSGADLGAEQARALLHAGPLRVVREESRTEGHTRTLYTLRV